MLCILNEAISILEPVERSSNCFHFAFFINSLQARQVGHLQEMVLLHQYHGVYRLTDVSVDLSGRPPHFEDLNQLQYTFPDSCHIPGTCKVEVSVRFSSATRGSFAQCLALNFAGREFFLSIPMNVDVGHEPSVRRVTKIRGKLKNDVPLWNDASTTIEKFKPRPPEITPEAERLLKRYEIPREDLLVPSFLLTEDKELSPQNYQRVMHQLLFVEERILQQQISR